MTNSARRYTPKKIREIMQEEGLNFSKGLGQNFLIDGHAVSRIGDLAELSPEDAVLEIGPGIGSLTEELLLRAGQVVSVEIDSSFIPVLDHAFSSNPNFHLVEGNALKIPLGPILEDIAPGQSWKLVANLPYYITGPLLEHFLTADLPIDTMTVMVQKEVARRMMARPSTSDYGALTLLVLLYSDVAGYFDVARTSFMPAPKVDSTVVHLKRKLLDEEAKKRKAKVNQLVRKAFQQRRKQVIKVFEQETVCKRDRVEEAFVLQGLDLRARAENLSLEDFESILENLGYI